MFDVQLPMDLYYLIRHYYLVLIDLAVRSINDFYNFSNRFPNNYIIL